MQAVLSDDIIQNCIYPYFSDWKLRISLGGDIQKELMNMYASRIQRRWRLVNKIRTDVNFLMGDDEDATDAGYATPYENDYIRLMSNRDKFEKIALWYPYFYRKYAKGYPKFIVKKLAHLGHPQEKIEIMYNHLTNIKIKTHLDVFKFLMKCYYDDCINIEDLVIVGV